MRRIFQNIKNADIIRNLNGLNNLIHQRLMGEKLTGRQIRPMKIELIKIQKLHACYSVTLASILNYS